MLCETDGVESSGPSLKIIPTPENSTNTDTAASKMSWRQNLFPVTFGFQAIEDFKAQVCNLFYLTLWHIRPQLLRSV